MNITPFALPNGEIGQVRFEEPRDIREVVVVFNGSPDKEIGLSYLQKTWPGIRSELAKEDVGPFEFGWLAMDDWFNVAWRPAAVCRTPRGKSAVVLTFQGLSREFGNEVKDYDVCFRRTLGVRVKTDNPDAIRRIEVYTTSAPARTSLRVQLDAGRKTRGGSISAVGYNASIKKLLPGKGASVEDGTLTFGRSRQPFVIALEHMTPAHRYCGDDGLLTLHLEHDSFTVRVDDPAQQGPIWYEEEGVFITHADDPTDLAAYKARIKKEKTFSTRVLERGEQTYAGAFHGQPRPHVTNYNIGCRHARQRFWIEHNGDLLLHAQNVRWVQGQDTALFKNRGNAHFFFGLETWAIRARHADPAPVLAYTLRATRGDMALEQRSLAVPLRRSILGGESSPDEPIVALVRFRLHNQGDTPEAVELPVAYSQDSHRSVNGFYPNDGQDEHMVSTAARDALTARRGRLTSEFEGEGVTRALYETSMKAKTEDGRVVFRQRLQPGGSCELLLKIPYVALETKGDIATLGALEFEECLREVTRFWREAHERGARVDTPVEQLNAGHAAHPSHVQVTDMAMPDDAWLINTSVGTSTYGNFSNESCMIIQELMQRGLHEDCKRRLELWVKYQGSVAQPGNFTDCDGMYYGAGGFECGAYNQHHGWVLWAIAEYFLHTGDQVWFDTVADSLAAGAEWVFRQRSETMQTLLHSRGWEHGFLPAGSLEDVTDFYYWLSTNALTWRGTDSAARALRAAGHPLADRIVAEAAAYRADLITGFETMRQHSPLVRLRNGRWIPHYPSRMYCRGRDLGWIREVLEGAIYLLISGLYDANGKQARWILEDYQDNRYHHPPYGYHVRDVDNNYYHVGGMSCQPLLLAGLMPYLERDEIEMYLWMFFNAWVSCYREEINGMIEHPAPVLGFNNSATFKTSDAANGMMWLRYMFVYEHNDVLYLGRALPRRWLANGETCGVGGVSTSFGLVDLRYRSHGGQDLVEVDANLRLRRRPERVILRIRHPEGKSIKGATVNGRKVRVLDAVKGDIDLTGRRGKLRLQARY